MREPESAARAAIQIGADERQRWADVLCAGPSCHQGRERCATPGRCSRPGAKPEMPANVQESDFPEVEMLGRLLIFAIAVIAFIVWKAMQ